jgi:hypothetical protein
MAQTLRICADFGGDSQSSPCAHAWMQLGARVRSMARAQGTVTVLHAIDSSVPS